MNTVLSTRLDEHTTTHPPSTRRRVSLPDRLALHLGLALITWSRRRRTLAPEPGAINTWSRNERARERARREDLWMHALYLSQPRR